MFLVNNFDNFLSAVPNHSQTNKHNKSYTTHICMCHQPEKACNANGWPIKNDTTQQQRAKIQISDYVAKDQIYIIDIYV